MRLQSTPGHALRANDDLGLSIEFAGFGRVCVKKKSYRDFVVQPSAKRIRNHMIFVNQGVTVIINDIEVVAAEWLAKLLCLSRAN